MHKFVLLSCVIFVYSFDAMTKDDTVLLVIDHQTGLINGVRDQSLAQLRQELLALAKTAQIFNLTTIISPSMADGPNGPLFPALLSILPNATVIPRHGEINAMENVEFAATVQRTGRHKFILSGVLTDICISHVALSLLEKGKRVYVALDSSGSYSKEAANLAMMRMAQMGAIPITTWAIASELQVDWRSSTGPLYTKLMMDYLPFYGNLVASFERGNKPSIQ
jgi:nicotinamidase-related amidase